MSFFVTCPLHDMTFKIYKKWKLEKYIVQRHVKFIQYNNGTEKAVLAA